MTNQADQLEEGIRFWNDFLKPVLFPAIGAFVAVFLKDFFDGKKSKKQYSVSDVEFLCQQIDEIREASLDYWSSKEKDGRALKEAQIMGRLHGCAEIISSTDIGSPLERSELNYGLRQFRKVCTSGSFGQSDMVPDFSRVAEIESEGRVFYAKALSFRRK